MSNANAMTANSEVASLLDILEGPPPSIENAPPLPPSPPPVEKRTPFLVGPAAAAAGAAPFMPPAPSKAEAKEIVANATAAKGSPMASKKFAELSKLIPGAERVRIRRRRTDGSLYTIKDYSKADIDHTGDIEAFIYNYLRPVYGGGEYNVSLVDAKGVELDGGIVRLEGPSLDPHAQPTTQDTNGPLLVEMFKTLTRPQPPPPDAISQFKNMKEILVEMTPKNDNSVLTAMMQMQMQMQQAQQSQAAENMKLFMAMMTTQSQKPAIDPALAALIDRMDRRLEKIETAASAPPMPPPPPPPPSGPNYTMPELITAVTGAIAAVVPLVKGDSVSAAEMATLIINAQAAAKPTDALGVRDVIDIFKQREQDQSPPATLEEQMGTLMRLKEFGTMLNPPPPPTAPGGTNIYDAMLAILGPGSAISQAIGSRVDRELQAPPAKRVEVTDIRHVQPTVQPAGSLVPSTPSAPAPAPTAPEEEAVPLPADFDAKLAAMNNASSPGERIGAAVDMLMSLYPIPQWQRLIQTILTTIASTPKDAEPAMRPIGGLLAKFVDAKMLPRETALATLKAFKDSYTTVRNELLEKLPMLRGLAPAESAEAEGEETEEDEAPAPSGPPPATVDLPGDMDAAAYSGGSL